MQAFVLILLQLRAIVRLVPSLPLVVSSILTRPSASHLSSASSLLSQLCCQRFHIFLKAGVGVVEGGNIVGEVGIGI